MPRLSISGVPEDSLERQIVGFQVGAGQEINSAVGARPQGAFQGRQTGDRPRKLTRVGKIHELHGMLPAAVDM
jgi:hypothetical protein